ncbi:condensation domain-containing protein [Actinoplanes sp. KI2]|uniref:condensation domain-containing protein n=1 Tax=Actinoplanes sp. KI2 TaxID=2983315 RepID=UPI0021D5FFF4|nr:condensation domain-containing protein [Actinoplanes sp. KI2]MCU7725989.1 condensation domain-containing protein [Actinoplanes sp. KI2]
MTMAEDELDAKLRDAWRSVLKIDKIDDGANFFMLGGTSIGLARVLAGVRPPQADRPSVVEFLSAPTYHDQLSRLREAWSVTPPVAAPSPSAASGVTRNQRNRLTRVSQRIIEGHPHVALSIPVCFAIDGPIDADALAGALRDTVERHGALRAAFLDRAAQPCYDERPLPPDWAPVIYDRRSLPPAEAIALIEQAAREVPYAVIDLREPPLLHAEIHLHRSGGAVLLAFDHIAFDEVSTVVFVRDLVEAYGARLTGSPVRLPAVPVRAQDILVERERRRGEKLDQLLAAWDEALAGYPNAPTFDLIDDDSDFSPPAPARVDRIVAGDLSGRLDGLRRQLGATDHTLLSALIYLALHRSTGRSDICLVTTAAMRDFEQADDVVGNFVELIIVRVEDVFGGTPCRAPLADVIRHVQRSIWRSHNLNVPFHDLLQRTQGLVNGRTPLRPWVFFNHTDDPLEKAELGQASFRWLLQPATATTSFPGLGMHSKTRADGAGEIAVTSVVDRYPPGTLDRFLEQLGLMLRDDHDPDQPLVRSAGAPWCGCAPAPVTS